MGEPGRNLLVATSSAKKVAEIRAALPAFLVEQASLDLVEPQGLDVVEVARAKAADAFGRLQRPVVVEDTGLEIRSWNGLPGALIKWFYETVGCAGILRMMHGEADRRAVARTAIALADARGVRVAVGERSGEITTTIRGENGFGFDPIFLPEGESMTYGEMDLETKSRDSHRTRALAALRVALEAEDR
jgi:XTP/dITP diphosphohydrolase